MPQNIFREIESKKNERRKNLNQFVTQDNNSFLSELMISEVIYVTKRSVIQFH